MPFLKEVKAKIGNRSILRLTGLNKLATFLFCHHLTEKILVITNRITFQVFLNVKSTKFNTKMQNQSDYCLKFEHYVLFVSSTSSKAKEKLIP